MTLTTEGMDMTETIRHGSFGPIVWAEDGSTRMTTQVDMDTLQVGEDLDEEEESSIPDDS